MARRKTDAKSEAPSREEILAFIAASPGKVGKREIARHFNLDSAGKVALKAVLKGMAEDGAIGKRRSRIERPGTLGAVVVGDVTGRDSDGDLIARPANWDEREQGPAPTIQLSPWRSQDMGPAPGVGDRVLIRIREGEPSEAGLAVGRVVKVLEKDKSRVLGLFRADPAGGGRIVAIEKKNSGREILVPKGLEGGAADGDLVAVDIARAGRLGVAHAAVKERLGSIKSEKAISLIAIHAHNIPNSFPRTTLEEAEAAKPATLSGREDWRKLPLVTIDPPDAKDHDDAVHAVADDSPDNPGGHIVTVAIADVASYVRPGTALDREALVRGNSVYFPDRVVPMLPERISNDLCSLKPDVDRPALAVRMIIAADGRKKSHTFHRIMMRSAAKLAYVDAQAAIDGMPSDATGPLVEPVLKPLWAAYASIKKARDQREPLDLDLPERKIVLNADGTIDKVITPARLDAHRLIEEFMILANVAAAETLIAQRVPLLFRVHDAPSPQKLLALKEFLQTLDIKFAKVAGVEPADFNHILRRGAAGESAAIINEVVLRSQAQALYSPENIGHFGLNLRRYAHFTSPIRRYADLVVHRALIRAFALGDDGLTDDEIDRLDDTGQRISDAERRAMAAERETVDRLIAHWLADRVGTIFEARISGVTRAGLFVRLDETGADGFIPAATIGDDYYRYEEHAHALIGNRSGETYALGDQVTVRLVEAAPIAGALRFEMLSEGRYESGRVRSAPGRRGAPGFAQRPGGGARKANGGRPTLPKSKSGPRSGSGPKGKSSGPKGKRR